MKGSALQIVYYRAVEDHRQDYEPQHHTQWLNGSHHCLQNQLEKLLREVILPNQEVTIEHRWSGIMGLGSGKNPIVTQLSDHVYCGVRLGGMGVAIGSLIGKELANLI